MDGVSDPGAERVGIDPATAVGQDIYHLMNSIVVPRPIAWVGTYGPGRVANVAPHSYCMIVSPNPPIIAFSSTGAKDTLRNAQETGAFVFNHVPEGLAEAMNRSSGDFPPDVSEFDWAGLTPVPAAMVDAPRVGESPASLECALLDVQEWGDGPSYLIFGKVLHIALDPAYVTDGLVDTTRTRPVGRLARTGYVRSRDFFAMPRPTYRGLLDAGEKPKR